MNGQSQDLLISNIFVWDSASSKTPVFGVLQKHQFRSGSNSVITKATPNATLWIKLDHNQSYPQYNPCRSNLVITKAISNASPEIFLYLVLLKSG